MRKTLLRTLVVVAALALVSAGAAEAIKLRIGNIVIVGDGGFTPTKLPKHRNAPIKLFGHATFKTVDGTRPSPLRTLTLEFDKHGAVETRGLPKCTMGKLVATTTKQARKPLPRSDRRHRLRHRPGRAARTAAESRSPRRSPCSTARSSTETPPCSGTPTSTTRRRRPTSS